MRLDKFLANSGVGTRTEVKKLIKKGLVKVDDKVIKDVGYDVKDLEVKLKDEIVSYRKYIYLMLNKPKDVVSAVYDKKYKTVIDLLNNDYYTYKLFPVGRLDIDTTGLIVLTNDGKLSHELLSPKKHIPKTYKVLVKNMILDEDIRRLESGVDIGGYITKDDAKLKLIDDFNCYLTISEGKFHQVKKMFLAVGNEVLDLKRVKMNNLSLDESLKEGEYRELSLDELKDLVKGGDYDIFS